MSTLKIMGIEPLHSDTFINEKLKFMAFSAQISSQNIKSKIASSASPEVFVFLDELCRPVTIKAAVHKRTGFLNPYRDWYINDTNGRPVILETTVAGMTSRWKDKELSALAQAYMIDKSRFKGMAHVGSATSIADEIARNKPKPLMLTNYSPDIIIARNNVEAIKLHRMQTALVNSGIRPVKNNTGFNITVTNDVEGGRIWGKAEKDAQIGDYVPRSFRIKTKEGKITDPRSKGFMTGLNAQRQENRNAEIGDMAFGFVDWATTMASAFEGVMGGRINKTVEPTNKNIRTGKADFKEQREAFKTRMQTVKPVIRDIGVIGVKSPKKVSNVKPFQRKKLTENLKISIPPQDPQNSQLSESNRPGFSGNWKKMTLEKRQILLIRALRKENYSPVEIEILAKMEHLSHSDIMTLIKFPAAPKRQTGSGAQQQPLPPAQTITPPGKNTAQSTKGRPYHNTVDTMLADNRMAKRKNFDYIGKVRDLDIKIPYPALEIVGIENEEFIIDSIKFNLLIALRNPSTKEDTQAFLRLKYPHLKVVDEGSTSPVAWVSGQNFYWSATHIKQIMSKTMHNGSMLNIIPHEFYHVKTTTLSKRQFHIDIKKFAPSKEKTREVQQVAHEEEYIEKRILEELNSVRKQAIMAKSQNVPLQNGYKFDLKNIFKGPVKGKYLNEVIEKFKHDWPDNITEFREDAHKIYNREFPERNP